HLELQRFAPSDPYACVKNRGRFPEFALDLGRMADTGYHPLYIECVSYPLKDEGFAIPEESHSVFETSDHS
ncbi:hypothetical protein, partial [Rhizobium ecuadorense]|uniref:hypothetical protein n=1 Tax=Rhizobium ecuadorense TaxID=1671795 RepID=UPI001AEBCD28